MLWVYDSSKIDANGKILEIKTDYLSKEQLSKYISGSVLIIITTFLVTFLLVFLFSKVIYNFTEVPFSYQIFTVILAFFQI